MDEKSRPQGWTLRRMPEGEACAECGGQAALLYQGRVLRESRWLDVPGKQLCTRCFTARWTPRVDRVAS